MAGCARLVAHTFSSGGKSADADHRRLDDWRNRLAEVAFEPKGFHQFTVPISRFRTFPSYLAMGSLDKAFVRGAIRVRHVRRRAEPAGQNRARDHLPLVVDFHLDGGQHAFPDNGATR